MSAFRRATLRDVATIERDIVEPSAIRAGTLFVGLENIESGGRLVNVRTVDNGELASSKFVFSPRHVLFGKLRPYLAKIARPNFDGICSTDILPVLPGPGLDRGYLSWLLLTPEMVAIAASRASGANLPRLSPNALADLRIPLPPLPEQRRIAEILDAADALRAKRRAALAQLDTLTQSIFLDMFGDPAANPKGWPVQVLSQIVAVNPAPDRSTSALASDARVSFVPMAAVSAEERRITRNELRPYGEVRKGYTAFIRGDVLVAKITPCYENGKMAIAADIPTKNGCGSTEFHVFRAEQPAIAIYIFHLLQLPVIATAGVARMKGAAGQRRVPADFFGSLRVPKPSDHALRIFSSRVEAIGSLKAQGRSALDEVDSLFSSLQHRAFRGEL